MDLDANKERCKVNITLNSRINPTHTKKAQLFRHSPGSVLNFRFVNNKVQQADAKISSVTRKEKQYVSMRVCEYPFWQSKNFCKEVPESS